MSHSQAESVIKNIIREIAQECAAKGQSVSETLVAFMVKAVVLDPANGFNVDRTLTKTDVQNLIKLCVDRLTDTINPSLDTIKMQIYFDMNYTNRGDFLEEHHRILDSRLAPVGREITDCRARSREELEALYRKIISYVLLRSGLGSPTDIKVVREATAALQSVFPQLELGNFLSLAKKDKELQLKELAMIVTGIRLFNKDSGKGGEGIDDLPSILNEAVPATTKHIDVNLQESQELAYQYTAILEMLEEKHDQSNEATKFLLRKALFNLRQHEVFLHIILGDVITCAQQVELMEKQLREQLEQLKYTVLAKLAVPTEQVYPHFISLSNLWNGFQDEIVLLSVLSNMVTNLQPFLGTHEQLLPPNVLEPLMTEVKVKSDEDRINETLGNRINVSDFKKQEFFFPENTVNFDQLTIQYHGFCGYTLAAKDGLLLPGNPDIGILKHNDKYYVFSSKESAYSFAKDPNKYIKLIGEKAKKHAELIQLLELYQQFASIIPYSQANLRRKVTHSMQTNNSNMRRENATQVYPPKQTGTQNKRDNSSNVPKPQIYLAGLRGGQTSTATEMVKVDLTRSVKET
uniref:Cilia- and flagella-associated protein 206 n=1 Tax=Geotrypetes seraphini TaxID=260995 RepID=A0A6P8Q9N6_GEOSA|nr:cilia- and flagella-associated protein 206 isoform X2 [Geotrypetes seraphini]